MVKEMGGEKPNFRKMANRGAKEFLHTLDKDGIFLASQMEVLSVAYRNGLEIVLESFYSEIKKNDS